ncbi:MAG: TatD family hydrolase [Methanosarcinales archaeon]|jgi:TatD-related deoxyribonuclease|nr:TatD family hydrolase [Methanosarcinales archaeon]
MSKLPITDHHIHIDMNRGRGLDAVSDFQNAGGTHLFLVSLPSRHLGVSVKKPEDYKTVFDLTIEAVSKINETGVTAFPVLGIHPVDILYLSEENSVEKAVEIMRGGFDIAASYVQKGEAVALKSGRPHFPVEHDIWDGSNQVISHVFSLCRDLKCAVQLHVEDMTLESIQDISEIAKRAGINTEKVVNHHATPLVTAAEKFGLYPSIPAAKDNIEIALAQGTRFLMETDYVDDPDRPGFVLGPKTVPKKTKKLIEIYGEEPFWKIHQENPSRIYDVDIGV